MLITVSPERSGVPPALQNQAADTTINIPLPQIFSPKCLLLQAFCCVTGSAPAPKCCLSSSCETRGDGDSPNHPHETCSGTSPRSLPSFGSWETPFGGSVTRDAAEPPLEQGIRAPLGTTVQNTRAAEQRHRIAPEGVFGCRTQTQTLQWLSCCSPAAPAPWAQHRASSHFSLFPLPRGLSPFCFSSHGSQFAQEWRGNFQCSLPKRRDNF